METTEDKMSFTEHGIRQKFFEYTTTITHIFIIGFVFCILYLCLTNELFLFTWHPVLLAIGWVLLMTEGILMLAPNNRLTKELSLSYKLKVQYHWIFQTVGVICSIAGFAVVYINKDLNEKPHFHSWHGIAGLISIIGCVPTCITGVAALYSFGLRNYAKPENNKFIHRICAITAFLIGLVTILLSLYSNWFQRKVSDIVTILWFIIILFVTLWCLIHAFIKVVNRYRFLYEK